MAFFGLSEIRFQHEDTRTFGPLAALEGENSKFKKDTLKYPLDVGSAAQGHYMIFFIREQEQTRFSADARGGQVFDSKAEEAIQQQFSVGNSVSNSITKSKVRNNYADKINNVLVGAITSGTDSIKNVGGSVGSKISGSVEKFFSANKTPSEVSFAEQKTNDNITKSIKNITDKTPFGFLNKTRLTSEAIALYMPNTIQFDSRQSYDGLSPGKELLGQALVAAPGLIEEYKRGGGKAALQAIKKTGAMQMLGERIAGSLGVGDSVTRLGVFGVTGRVVNPMLELIYNSPDFRQFQFEFLFYPRDEVEALEVQKIIDRFRFHQAPELEVIGGKQSGLLIPPSEFDIKFFYAGRQNPNIPPIASCVLESVQVNYAPNGWVAYEVPGENNPDLGRTGMPVTIQMTLMFRETTYITKEDFDVQQGTNAAGGI